jgi:hypothetical protein
MNPSPFRRRHPLLFDLMACVWGLVIAAAMVGLFTGLFWLVLTILRIAAIIR